MFSAEIQLATKTSLVGDVFISLPVAVNGSSATSISLGLVNNMNTNCVSHLAFANPSAATAGLRFKTSASPGTDYTAVQASDISGTFRIIYGGSYICAD